MGLAMIGSITQRVMLLGLAFFGGGSWIQRPMRMPLGADFVETAGTIMQMKPHQSAASMRRLGLSRFLFLHLLFP